MYLQVGVNKSNLAIIFLGNDRLTVSMINRNIMCFMCIYELVLELELIALIQVSRRFVGDHMSAKNTLLCKPTLYSSTDIQILCILFCICRIVA